MRIPRMYKPLVKELRALGYRIETRSSGHLAILTAEGKFLQPMSSSPSDFRAPLALRCDLRKKGVPV